MVVSLKKAWHGSEPIVRNPDGLLALNFSSPDLRYALLRLGLRPSQLLDDRDLKQLHPAVLRAFPESGKPKAVSLVDVEVRSILTFFEAEFSLLKRALTKYDILAGLHIRDTLVQMELDADRWNLVDLKPPQKSRRINRRGKTLTITPELLITSTTGISRPLGLPEKTIWKSIYRRTERNI